MNTQLVALKALAENLFLCALTPEFQGFEISYLVYFCFLLLLDNLNFIFNYKSESIFQLSDIKNALNFEFFEQVSFFIFFVFSFGFFLLAPILPFKKVILYSFLLKFISIVLLNLALEHIDL